MKPPTLYNKLVELYSVKEQPDNESIERCVQNYLHKQHAQKKINNIISQLSCNKQIEKESKKHKNKKALSSYIDSIVLGRIREAGNNSTVMDIDGLDEIKFKSLIKQLIIHFGYKVLYIPPVYSHTIDMIISRDNLKIAVFVIKHEPGFKIKSHTIQKTKYISNMYNCDKLMVFTNAFFSDELKNKETGMNMTLIDRKKLLPLVQDIVDNRRETEKELLIDNMSEGSTLFLEKIIKFPKTKVQVADIGYNHKENEGLSFEGKLFNTGKKPVSNLSLFIKIFDRNDSCTYEKNFPILEGLMDSNQEIAFNVCFEDIPGKNMKNLCRYELRLDYKNVYKI